jgi:hypothetical protein
MKGKIKALSALSKRKHTKNEHTCVQSNDVSTNVCSMWGLIPYGEVEVAS